MNAIATGIRARIHRVYTQLRVRLGLPYRTCLVTGDNRYTPSIGRIYIIEEDGFIEHASMLCPCGCGVLICLNLIPDESPCWRLDRHRGGAVSLFPSVWRTTGCRSHFWLSRGRVRWCRQSESGDETGRRGVLAWRI